jgi:hypothetical protein
VRNLKKSNAFSVALLVVKVIVAGGTAVSAEGFVLEMVSVVTFTIKETHKTGLSADADELNGDSLQS